MFIRCTAMFRSDISDVEFELMSDEQKMEASNSRQFRFLAENLESYNETTAKGKPATTIRLKSGYDIVINIPISELDKIRTQEIISEPCNHIWENSGTTTTPDVKCLLCGQNKSVQA